MKTNLNSRLLLFVTGLLSGIFMISVFAFNGDKINNEIKGGGNEKAGGKGQYDPLPYKWHSPKVPDTMSFAGEPVPLERWEIREAMDRQLLYNYYWQNNMLYILKLANRYFPLIEERLKANDVPDDFKYLCVAESNLQNAISRSGAVGFWQFMSGTAPGYNLEISTSVDERYHVIKSTDAACKYLKLAYSKFGSWTGAAASYNCGQGGYASHSDFQKTNNYYDLLLPEETNRYIFRILTFKHLMENAKEMGYILEQNDLYDVPPTRTITITQSIPNLTDFAIENGTTYKMLKLLNPWLRSRSLVIKPGKTYSINLPPEHLGINEVEGE